MESIRIFTILVCVLGFFSLELVATANVSIEEWRKRTIYQVLTDRFNNLNGGWCTDLSQYCGGTYDGIISRIDYLQDLGVDALWISPVIDQAEDSSYGYHGYWAGDWYDINWHFGGDDGLKRLVTACHSADILVMVDVVANHSGNCNGGRYDYSCVSPFSDSSSYHSDDCDIEDWSNQYEVEHCRLSGLPDLNQENESVQDELYNWINWIVSEYDFDGVRIDTVPEVRADFWDGYVSSSGVSFLIGEVFNGDPAYVGPYQDHVPSVFNYPMYYTIRDVYGGGSSCWNINSRRSQIYENFADPSLLGLFASNHDNPRFLHDYDDPQRLRNAMVYVLAGEGVPVVYYGDEQEFAGGSDPYCRECLWPSGFDTSGDVFTTISLLAHARQKNYDNWVLSDFVERYVLDNLYVFSRGDVLFATTNVGDNSGTEHFVIDNSPFTAGESICDVFYPSTDCFDVNSDGTVDIWLLNGEPKVYVRESDVNNFLG
ncbi:Alpha-amylase [Aduncisulcus paluster]|uniref:alpha-amylase n=1 Tax=Aduncisulcus paluster TaxID=2918883 RepID=A0ABQ5KUE5_9EUKA|nr:Alpha-amylase [Aduncisulcus paluster]